VRFCRCDLDEEGRHVIPACETCGAIGHGNIGCIDCCIWHKRMSKGCGSTYRMLIRIHRRAGRVGAQHRFKRAA
jgi:hypothetical protein